MKGSPTEQRQMFGYALGSYPPPANGGVVYELWRKHMRPWRPGSGNLASNLSDTECEEATRWVECIFREFEGEAADRLC